MTRLAYCLMVQDLCGKRTTREPARPGPSRVHRWLGEEAEDERTLHGGHTDVPAVSDSGAKLLVLLIERLTATSSTTATQHSARSKLTAVDAEVDGPNAGGSASPASGAADQARLKGLQVAKSGQVVANGATSL